MYINKINIKRPPIFPSDKYLMESDKISTLLITKEEYLKMIEQGLLIKNKICEKYLTNDKNEKNHDEILKIKKQKPSNNVAVVSKVEKNNKGNLFYSDSKVRNDMWNFEVLTIEDENPQIILSMYIQSLNIFHTKNNLDKLINKHKKKII